MYLQYMGWPLREIPWVRITARGARNNENTEAAPKQKNAQRYVCLQNIHLMKYIHVLIQ